MSAIGDHVDCVFGSGKVVSIKGDLAGIALDKWTTTGVSASEVYVKLASLKPYTEKVVAAKVDVVVPPAPAKTVKAVGVTAAGNKLETITIERRAVGPDDIGITVKYAGICHSGKHSYMRYLFPPVSHWRCN